MTEPDDYRDRPHELHADERAHFMSTTDFEHSVEGEVASGTATIGPYLMSGRRWPIASILLTFADILIGLQASHRTAPRISVTSDLSVRVLSPVPDDGRVELRSHLVKAGRTMSVGETEIVAARTATTVAVAIGTFLASPRPTDVAPDGFPRLRPRGSVRSTSPTLVEHVGIRTVEPGVTELALRPDLHNATQSLQGGLVSLMGEVAAQSAAAEAAGEPRVVDGLDVHYLAAARVGPFRAVAAMLDDHQARVEIRDPGRDDRVVSVILAHTRPSP